jgi:hypothetical protein
MRHFKSIVIFSILNLLEENVFIVNFLEIRKNIFRFIIINFFGSRLYDYSLINLNLNMI